VKINDVCIELGEIDAARGAVDGVKSSVTSLYRPADGPPVSYVVPSGAGLDRERIRNELFERLPAYMVPRQHVVLERLPLSPNGKVLRTALPAPEADNSADTAAVEPRTMMERIFSALLLTAWS
jgi:acyl-coenzyme A synthetase/AMP-(fatty) acid ligase